MLGVSLIARANFHELKANSRLCSGIMNFEISLLLESELPEAEKLLRLSLNFFQQVAIAWQEF